MAEFKETVENIRQEEASVRNLFGGEGSRVREARTRTPKYMESLAECANFMSQVMDGTRPMTHLREAMTTSDFPVLFSDVLDRQLLAGYQEVQPTWTNYIRRGTAPDFRDVKRVALDGAEGPLDEVDQLEEYPQAALQESVDSWHVRKFGKRLDLSWETLVNDDLDAFRNAPQRLARGARRTESRMAVELFVDANGPHADVYTAPHGNIIAGNPELSPEALQAAMVQLSAASDVDDEPILIEQFELVVPPALEVTALNILNATEVWLQNESNRTLVTANWAKSRFRLSVEPYIPRIATGPEGANSWFLFANPNSGRAWAEMGFLRGYETPGLYERIPDSRAIGGGGDRGSFTDDSYAWKVCHVIGGGHLNNTRGYLATAASDGSGS
jgi:hypothetical protein